MIIPLIPTLALAFLSFLSSAFVILRIVIPILPPHPLSRRVAPSEFGLPNFRSLTTADKSHLWLAGLDIIALGIFLWQAVSEYLGGPSGYGIAQDTLSTARVWFALTARQICLLVVASLTLLHIRLSRSVSFGKKHWLLWVPATLFICASTAVATVLTGVGMMSLFPGMIAFSGTITILSSAAFISMAVTLILTRRKAVAAAKEAADPWPPAKAQMEELPRPSFATEEVDALRDNASWLTSENGSHCRTISSWSFSSSHYTHQTQHSGSVHVHPATASYPSIPPKSSFWFTPVTPHTAVSTDALVPPVPPLPSVYRSDTPMPCSPPPEDLLDGQDPFGRGSPGRSARQRLGSQTSWLTSTDGSHATVPAWSFTEDHSTVPSPALTHSPISPASSNVDLPLTSGLRSPAMASAQVLGGYGFTDAEKAGHDVSFNTIENADFSLRRTVGWLALIWIPFGLSVPYMLAITMGTAVSEVVPILLVLSVTMSAPILAVNIVLHSPVPITTSIFETSREPSPNVIRSATPSTLDAPRIVEPYKRSGSSMTVVDGRRSGDIWIANGDAVAGKSKLGRAVGMLTPKPQLSVLPIKDTNDNLLTPPLPIQCGDSSMSHLTLSPQSQSYISMEMGKLGSKTSTTPSSVSAEADASRIMVAHRHYSALATTIAVPPSPSKPPTKFTDQLEVTDKDKASSTAIKKPFKGSHLRSRSTASINGTFDSICPTHIPTPPPSIPLPPTPPSLKASREARQAQLAAAHKKSFSIGSVFSFGSVDNHNNSDDYVNEIDALTAGVLPLLVPGLKVGKDMRVIQPRWTSTPPNNRGKKGSTTRTRAGPKMSWSRLSSEFGALPSPDGHSTPNLLRGVLTREKKISGHRKNHYSLPSLGLGRNGTYSLLASWNEDLDRIVNKDLPPLPADAIARRNTVALGEFKRLPHLPAPLIVTEDEGATLSASLKAPSFANTSLNTLLGEVNTGDIPPSSAASTTTLFELNESFGPEAHSTPHGKTTPKDDSILSASHLRNIKNIKNERRSSIIYIKSDDSGSAFFNIGDDDENSNANYNNNFKKSAHLRNTGKPQHKSSSSPQRGSGLRPLSLLQQQELGTTRPLYLSKKGTRSNASSDAENVSPTTNLQLKMKSKNLKPLQLARSETTKQRGLLRKNEVLPEVVVRPPSQGEALQPRVLSDHGLPVGFR